MIPVGRGFSMRKLTYKFRLDETCCTWWNWLNVWETIVPEFHYFDNPRFYWYFHQWVHLFVFILTNYTFRHFSECVTVDGRNLAPVDRLSHYLQGVIHPRWLAGFLPSTESPQGSGSSQRSHNFSSGIRRSTKCLDIRDDLTYPSGIHVWKLVRKSIKHQIWIRILKHTGAHRILYGLYGTSSIWRVYKLMFLLYTSRGTVKTNWCFSTWIISNHVNFEDLKVKPEIHQAKWEVHMSLK